MIQNSWSWRRCLAALERTEGGWPEHVWELLRTTPLEAVTEHPLFFREAKDCQEYGRGRVSLLGDAAHLTAAAMGQVLHSQGWHAIDDRGRLRNLGPRYLIFKAFLWQL